MSIFSNRGEFEATYRSAIARAVAGGTFGHDLAEADRGANLHDHRQSGTAVAAPVAPTGSAEKARSRLSLAVDRHIAGNRAGMVEDPNRRKTGLSAAVDREIASLRAAQAGTVAPVADAAKDARSGLSRRIDAYVATLRRS